MPSALLIVDSTINDATDTRECQRRDRRRMSDPI
jgi:hypothetical protein